MEDRELLELAAKAAGIHLDWPQDLGGAEFLSPHETVNWREWNPLEDDGDALRLAVKLRITDLALAVGELIVEESRSASDPYITTRRAIVRAAAEIGKGM